MTFHTKLILYFNLVPNPHLIGYDIIPNPTLIGCDVIPNPNLKANNKRYDVIPNLRPHP